MPADKPLTFAGYDAGPPPGAYVEPVAVGDEVPDVPLFLRPEIYVDTPLAATYAATFNALPAPVRRLAGGG